MPEHTLPAPSQFHPQLTVERLSVIAEGILNVLDNTYSQLSTSLDDNYTRGTCTFGRQRQYLIQLCMSKVHDWLRLTHAGMDVTFEIENIPVRFFSDDPEHPKKPGFFRRNSVDQLWAPDATIPTMWRFVVEKPEFEGEGARVHFVGYSPLEDVLSLWTYGDERVVVLHSTDDTPPAPVEIVLDDISASVPEKGKKRSDKE